MASASFKAGMTKETMISAGCSGVDLPKNTLFSENGFCSCEIISDLALSANPFQIAFDPFFQAHSGRVPGIPNQGRIRYQMPHFTGPKLVIHDRSEPDLQSVGNQSSDLSDRDRATASDVHRPAVQLLRSGSEQVGLSDVFYKAEITGLLSIFVNHWR